MATETIDATTQIGGVAGGVWRYLADNGATSITALLKELDYPRDMIMQGIGWLAREEKIQIEQQARAKILRLR